ncbi:MAG: hypothetical protein JSR80_02825 [Verrucomicrobia bacterium]|nr:hypothetical protein [Verrucomicrobiota bacterium]
MFIRLLCTTFLCLCLGGIWLTPLGATNGLRQIGYGIKAKGMGGCAIAHPQDSFAVANNPAGLPLLPPSIEADLFWRRQGDKNSLFPQAAAHLYTAPGQVLGAAVYTYGFFASSHCSYGAYLFTPAFAWQATRCHSLGISLSLAFERFHLHGVTFSPSVAPDLATNMGPDYEWGIGARVGWIGRFRHLQLGATFQTPLIFSLLRKYRGFLPGGGELNLPAELGVGAAYCARRFEACVEVMELFWHSLRVFQRFSSAPFGADEGPGFSWSNQTVFKLGLSYLLTECLTLRAGYNYGPCPQIAGNPLNALTQELAHTHLTAGISYKRACHEISAFYCAGIRGQMSAGVSYAWRFL